VTTNIIHLHDFKLHMYKGNFAQFEEMYDQQRRKLCWAGSLRCAA
jgi:ATP-binding cassette subfamily F protein 1